jgi:hypothetical protein
MKYSFLLLFSFCVISCSKQQDFLPLEDYYSLESVRCLCPDIEIISQQQQWKFDFEENELDVIVHGDNKNWMLLDQGFYTFEVKDSITSLGDSTKFFNVNNRSFWFNSFENCIILNDAIAAPDAGAQYSFKMN